LSGKLPYGIVMSQRASRKSARLEARISADQKSLFERAAALQGKSLTDFLVSSAHDAALRTIEQVERIRLNARDSAAFAEALLNPRPPTQRLRLAAQRYRKMLGG
jgi:uncharacterized protein (DUF1778 family)